MNLDSIKKNKDAVIGYFNGEKVQYLTSNNIWLDTLHPVFSEDVKYRVKPELKYRPYNDTEILELVGKVIYPANEPNQRYLVLNCLKNEIEIAFNGSLYKYNRDSLLLNWLIAGKPCGVEE